MIVITKNKQGLSRHTQIDFNQFKTNENARNKKTSGRSKTKTEVMQQDYMNNLTTATHTDWKR